MGWQRRCRWKRRGRGWECRLVQCDSRVGVISGGGDFAQQAGGSARSRCDRRRLRLFVLIAAALPLRPLELLSQARNLLMEMLGGAAALARRSRLKLGKPGLATLEAIGHAA